MANINEKRFYQALEDVFVGASIEGDSGYVNLLKLKSMYYKEILTCFKDDVASKTIITESFKEEFFDRLYSFFEKYFSESGSVYFVKTANWQRVYEQVYSDNKDLALFWKTHMLYYVKSDILFQNMVVTVKDVNTRIDYNFFFDVGALKAKQNNEKKSIVFNYQGLKEDKEIDNNNTGNIKKTYQFSVSYSERGNKTKIDDISKDSKIPEYVLEKAFASFNKQSEVDFFINKNAEKFLTEQLDMYLHQILLNEENIFDQNRLDQIKCIKEFALKIIKFIAQFEDELVKIWNKPKFALNSNYVLTIDKLSQDILGKIIKHQNINEQIKEWKELNLIDDNFKIENILNYDILGNLDGKFKYLPVDTKYFKDLEIEILSLFSNLDEALDGRFIHSENYQALNTLQEKYKEKVQCIYIDPPYNTDSSPIIYANNYRHSSWLTLMENRLEASKKLLKQDGINITAIDDVELRYLINLQDDLFGEENYITTITTKSNPQGRVANKVSKTSEFHILHAKNIAEIDRITVKKLGEKNPVPLKRTGTNSRRYERPYRYYPILIKNNKIFMITDEEYVSIYNSINKKFNDEYIIHLKNKYEAMGFVFVLPQGMNGEELVWQRTFNRVKEECKDYIIEGTTIKTPAFDDEIPKTLWDDTLYSNPEYGTEYLKHILGQNIFETPKSYYTIKQFLSMFDNEGIFLDYFGGSGTTAEAVIKSNIEDDGTRKYIIVELGDHFNTVIIPRIKKICFSDKWKNGKAQNGIGVSQFFKYEAFEQYEESLKNMKYKVDSPTSIIDQKKAFEQYVFYADQKFAQVLELNNEILNLNFNKLYDNIDFAETISNLLGLPIKNITKSSVVLLDGDIEREIKTDYQNMTNEEKLDFVRLLKPLLWWGK